jgi:hypothetical protein
LGSIRTPKISGLILRHELLSPPPRNFQRGNLLYKLVSSTNLGGILKNRHLSNATGRIRDESLINLGGRDRHEVTPTLRRQREENLLHE